MRVPETFYIQVPYPEKDDAKSLGAKWDPINRLWYIPIGKEIKNFSRWFAFLHVGYEDRGIVKNKGAKYNKKIKKWYVDNPRDYQNFKQWWPTDHFNSLYQSIYELDIINERYERVKEEKVMIGGTAQVVICRDLERNEEVVALKFYDPTLKGSDLDTAETVYKKEIMALQDLEDHPNILQILDNDFCKEVGMYYTVLEYAPFTFYELIKYDDISSKEEFHERFKNHVSELEAIYGAMKFAHEKGWIHRDLKPENIVFKIDEMTKVLIRDEDIDFEDVDIIKVKNLFKQGIKEEDDDEDDEDDEKNKLLIKEVMEKINNSIKICDFGISKLKDFNTTGRTLRSWHSPPWTPPSNSIDLRQNYTTSKEDYYRQTATNYRYDVWSLGALSVALWDLKIYESDDYPALYKSLDRIKSDKNLPEEYKNLLSRCLSPMEIDRPENAIEVYLELQKIKKKYLS